MISFNFGTVFKKTYLFFLGKIIIIFYLKICFAPTTNDIITVFKDDSIYVWTSENISLKCQFNTCVESSSSSSEPKHFYKCFSVSR